MITFYLFTFVYHSHAIDSWQNDRYSDEKLLISQKVQNLKEQG